MHIKIWSDIRCPFCYIGKKHFEAALEQFPHNDKVTIEWKSFELDPNLKTDTDTDAISHFVENKGIDKERAIMMFDNVTAMAAKAGIAFHLEQAIPANSLKAHRLLHFAKKQELAHLTKAALLQAHLCDGLNIDDVEVLADIAMEQGMDKQEVIDMLTSEAYIYDVRQDEMEARNLGISGVPFFVIDNTYGVSGAQPVSVFKESLEKAWEKHQENIEVITTDASCDLDGRCC